MNVFLKALSTLALLPLLSSASSAIYNSSLQNVCRQADLIAIGTISRVDQTDDKRTATLESTQILKGAESLKVIEIRFSSSGRLSFRPEEKVLVILRQTDHSQYSTLNHEFGKLPIYEKEITETHRIPSLKPGEYEIVKKRVVTEVIEVPMIYFNHSGLKPHTPLKETVRTIENYLSR